MKIFLYVNNKYDPKIVHSWKAYFLFFNLLPVREISIHAWLSKDNQKGHGYKIICTSKFEIQTFMLECILSIFDIEGHHWKADFIFFHMIPHLWKISVASVRKDNLKWCLFSEMFQNAFINYAFWIWQPATKKLPCEHDSEPIVVPRARYCVKSAVRKLFCSARFQLLKMYSF